MRQITKLVRWYYKADYTFWWRKKYPKILESLEDQTLPEIRRIVNTIVTDNGLSELIANALDCVGKGIEISTVNREYLERLSQSDTKKLSWRKWDCLRFLMCGKGLLQMSHVCREKAISRLYEHRKAYGALRRIACEIERGNYDSAYALVKSKSFLALKLFDKKQYLQCEDICATLSEGKKIADKFGEYVEGKRIVILGPAPHDKGMTDYDEDKDIIARFTYRGKEYIPECDKEIPTNVSYYNGLAETYMESHDISAFKRDLEFICYKRQEAKEQFDEFPFKRRIHLFDPCIVFGQAYMMPNAVFDCMHYNVSSIYVRNCNLYMAKEYYDRNYSSMEDKGNQFRLYTFAVHDYEGQFNLLKALYATGKFQCDEECRNVLSLSVEEYIRNMEIIFGAW